jgi:uncharacterized protein
MTRLMGMIVLAVCLALPAQAQQSVSPQTMQIARELAATVTGETVAQITGSMTAQIWPTIAQQVGGKVDEATLKEMRAEFESALASFTGEMLKDAPTVYARHFSAKELSDMLAFYKSPTGAKALHEMPKVIADMGAQMAPRMQEFQVALNAKLVAIMKKHGYN